MSLKRAKECNEKQNERTNDIDEMCNTGWSKSRATHSWHMFYLSKKITL
jgi:hypothetical protein